MRWMISSTSFLNCWKSGQHYKSNNPASHKPFQQFSEAHSFQEMCCNEVQWLVYPEELSKITNTKVVAVVEPFARQKSMSVGRQPKPLFLATHLCRFLLKELHFSILKKCKEARDDVFQEGGVLRRRCHILKLTSQERVMSIYPASMFPCKAFLCCWKLFSLYENTDNIVPGYSNNFLENHTFGDTMKLLKIHHNPSAETKKMNTLHHTRCEHSSNLPQSSRWPPASSSA